MAVASRHEGDFYVNGNISCLTLTPPASSITNNSIVANAQIAASKTVRHESLNLEIAAPGTAITAATKLAHIVRGATGTLVGIQAAITTVATGADRTITVDLLKSSGGGAFATVLSSTIGFTNVSAVRTAVSGILSSAGLVAGDILEIVVTVAGAAGAQAAGLLVTLTFEETYQ
jgi:hypothetical protein